MTIDRKRVRRNRTNRIEKQCARRKKAKEKVGSARDFPESDGRNDYTVNTCVKDFCVKICVLWDVMICSLVHRQGYECFGGTFCHHLQGKCPLL